MCVYWIFVKLEFDRIVHIKKIEMLNSIFVVSTYVLQQAVLQFVLLGNVSFHRYVILS